MPRWKLLGNVFVLVAVAAAAMFWLLADWEVGSSSGTFEMPLLGRIAVSATFGLAAASIVTLAVQMIILLTHKAQQLAGHH